MGKTELVMNKYDLCPPVTIKQLGGNKLFKIITIILSSFYKYQS